MRNPFGWDYPAGAANDPNAPWNEKDHASACPAGSDAPQFCVDCGGVVAAELHKTENPKKVADKWGREVCLCAESDLWLLRVLRWANLAAPYAYGFEEPKCRCAEIERDARESAAEARADARRDD